jgi:endogenous inhibitor of DNA gyrase (YacG/DUF329 family)
LPRQPQKPKNPRAHPDYGRLIKPGDRLACHLCGRAFHHLGNHVKRTHGLEADEYREMFGLMQKSTLMSMARKAKRHVEHLREHQRRAGAILRAISPEERRATKRKFSKRAEYRLDPHLAAVRKAALVKAHESVRQKRAAGTFKQPIMSESQKRKMGKRLKERLRELHADPAWHERWRKNLVDSKDARETRPCSVCGEPVTRPRHLFKGAVICSDRCLRDFRRQVAAEANVMNRPEVRAKVSEKARENIGQRERDAQGRLVGDTPHPGTRVQERLTDKLPAAQPWFITHLQWRVLCLHVQEGVPYAHIAEVLGLTVGRVKSLAETASGRLQERAGDDEVGRALGLTPDTQPTLAKLCFAHKMTPQAFLAWVLPGRTVTGVQRFVAEETGLTPGREAIRRWQEMFASLGDA